MVNPTLIDFFCGAGGMGLGFKNAGFDIVAAYDFDKYAVETYKHNIGEHVQQMDITKLQGKDLPYATGYAFGFPCQDISLAGGRAGMVKGKTRSGMFYEIMRLLDEVDEKPMFILAENVKAVNKFIPTIEEEYDKAGYKLIRPQLYNSKYWNLPQNRERYFLLGIRKDLNINFQFPHQQTDFIPKLTSILESNPDEKYYMSDVKTLSILEAAEDGLRVKQATKKGYDIAEVGDTININYPSSKTRRGRVGKQISQTLTTVQELVVVESRQPFVHNKGKLRFSDTANCIDANYHKGMDNHGQRTQILDLDQWTIRKLTPRETARLQGFPDHFEQVVSDTQFFKQMGNAVSVPVAEAIAKAIKEVL